MKSKWKIIAAILVLSAGFYYFMKPKQAEGPAQTTREVAPVQGNIEKLITATGSVQPQNRLEMKPPVAGRVDEIRVTEGQEVKAGEVVALLSSTERAALLDAAKSKSDEEKKYWEEIYKSIPLIAPIDGTVIVSTMQPGQTVTQTDAIIVLSNRLIVQAQIDETDIGKVKEGQKAVITLDAYPDIEVAAEVSHIYYESKVVSNVTIYQVDILPNEVPPVFRSGMSANVRIVEEGKENVLTVPVEAVQKDKEGSYVLVAGGSNKKPVRRIVELGLADDSNAEVLSGLDENDTVVIMTQKYQAPKAPKAGGGSPLTPQGPRRSRTNTGGGSSNR